MKSPTIAVPFVLASALLTSALAQDDGSAMDEEIFELSPFTIDASKDTGYRAKDTLSGSRLKVSLDDVATPLDIITPELMEDFAVSDIDDLMNVVSNVEEGDSLFFDAVYANGSNYRIRGFYNVTQLRNFLGGRMPFDSYNSTRLVAAKGPNSVLYGTGPAGGAMSFFTKQHQFGSKERTSVSLELDNWGTKRATLDMDRTLIDGKWGYHFSMVHDDRKYEIRPDYQEKNGYYFATKYALFENTTLAGTYERRSEEAFRGSGNFTAMQDQVTAWLDAGQALVTGTKSVRLPDGTELTNVNIKDYGVYWNNARGIQQNTVNDDGELYNWGRRALSDTRPIISSHQTDRRFQSPIWPRDINPTGVNGGAYVDQEAWDITIEQKVNDKLYLMAVFGENNMDREQYQMRIRNHMVDVNYYLPGADGSFTTELNPNAGRPYIEMTAPSMWTRLQGTQTQTYTATYELDLEGDVNKWLGKHNFATMYSKQTDVSGGNQGKFQLAEHPGAIDGSTSGVKTWHDVTSMKNTQYLDLVFREYVDWEEGGYMRDLRYLVDQGYYEQDGMRWEYNNGMRIDHSKNETTSKMGVIQSSWLGNRIVTTIGYRDESIDKYQAFPGENPDYYGRQSFYDFYTLQDTLDDPDFLNKRVFLPTLDQRPEGYGDVPFETVSGISKNIGGVFKITPNLALTYSKAQNIAGGSSRTGLFGVPLPVPGGESEDIGIRWNLMDGKLRIEYSKYETASANASQEYGRNRSGLGDARAIMEIMNSEFVAVDNGEGGYNVMANPNRTPFVDPFTDESKWDTYDDAAVGHEISITGSPIRNSSIRLMVTKNENSKANMGGEWRAWWAENGDTITNWANANSDFHLATDAGLHPDTGEQVWSINNEDASEKLQGITDIHQVREIEEALPNYNLASWSAKLVAKYSFKDGKLKGQEMGTNVAWRDKIITGHWKDENNELDINRPLFMPDTTFVSVFWNYSKKINFAGNDARWKIQVNVDNLFDSYGEMLRSPRNVYPEEGSEIAYWGYKYNRGRQYKLTNSISF